MSWICPHCETAAVIRDEDKKTSAIDLDSSFGLWRYEVKGITCPNPECRKPTITVEMAEYSDFGTHKLLKHARKVARVLPQLTKQRAKDYPAYIPHGILTDYQEACAIVELSPKASATLARRCLQGMIRDFWKVKPDTLFNEIQAIEEKVDPAIWEAIDSTRKVGNIGAHMEKDINLIIDVNPDEANLLIEMIEMLLEDWYIARHERAQKLQRIKDMAAEKSEARKG
ncbi:DUF4145 domain-containing protein [Kluyvera genomosp. 2]|uniref:DUF4145 domain-containing protein n=1 Tax=Kluyvera genomosp. 2 TaxID=2774054 RepID=UPI002FD7DFE2